MINKRFLGKGGIVDYQTSNTAYDKLAFIADNYPDMVKMYDTIMDHLKLPSNEGGSCPYINHTYTAPACYVPLGDLSCMGYDLTKPEDLEIFKRSINIKDYKLSRFNPKIIAADYTITAKAANNVKLLKAILESMFPEGLSIPWDTVTNGVMPSNSMYLAEYYMDWDSSYAYSDLFSEDKPLKESSWNLKPYSYYSSTFLVYVTPSNIPSTYKEAHPEGLTIDTFAELLAKNVDSSFSELYDVSKKNIFMTIATGYTSTEAGTTLKNALYNHYITCKDKGAEPSYITLDDYPTAISTSTKTVLAKPTIVFPISSTYNNGYNDGFQLHVVNYNRTNADYINLSPITTFYEKYEVGCDANKLKVTHMLPDGINADTYSIIQAKVSTNLPKISEFTDVIPAKPDNNILPTSDVY